MSLSLWANLLGGAAVTVLAYLAGSWRKAGYGERRYSDGHAAGVTWRNRIIENRLRDGWRLVLGPDMVPGWADMARGGYLEPPAAALLEPEQEKHMAELERAWGVPAPDDYPDACPPAGVPCGQCGTTSGCDAPGEQAAAWPPPGLEADADRIDAMATDAAEQAALLGDADLAALLAQLPPVGRHHAAPAALERAQIHYCPGCGGPLLERNGQHCPGCGWMSGAFRSHWLGSQVAVWEYQRADDTLTLIDPPPAADPDDLTVIFADEPPRPEPDLAALAAQARQAAYGWADTGQFRAVMETSRAAWCESNGVPFEPIEWGE